MRAPAKINWSLRITGRRADGFHDLETAFQTISLYDELELEPAERLSLTCDDPSIPVDASNLVLRAARALGEPAVAIKLRKRIPAGGGLGGGSSGCPTGRPPSSAAARRPGRGDVDPRPPCRHPR